MLHNFKLAKKISNFSKYHYHFNKIYFIHIWRKHFGFPCIENSQNWTWNTNLNLDWGDLCENCWFSKLCGVPLCEKCWVSTLPKRRPQIGSTWAITGKSLSCTIDLLDLVFVEFRLMASLKDSLRFKPLHGKSKQQISS